MQQDFMPIITSLKVSFGKYEPPLENNNYIFISDFTKWKLNEILIADQQANFSSPKALMLTFLFCNMIIKFIY